MPLAVNYAVTQKKEHWMLQCTLARRLGLPYTAHPPGVFVLKTDSTDGAPWTCFQKRCRASNLGIIFTDSEEPSELSAGTQKFLAETDRTGGFDAGESPDNWPLGLEQSQPESMPTVYCCGARAEALLVSGSPTLAVGGGFA